MAILSQKARSTYQSLNDQRNIQQGFAGLASVTPSLLNLSQIRRQAQQYRDQKAAQDRAFKMQEDALTFQQDRVLRPQNEAMDAAFGPLKQRPMSREAIKAEQDSLGPLRPAQPSSFRRTPPTPIDPVGFDAGMGPPDGRRSLAMMEEPAAPPKPTVDDRVRAAIGGRADAMRTEARGDQATSYLEKNHPDVLQKFNVIARAQGWDRETRAMALQWVSAQAEDQARQQKVALEQAKAQARGEEARRTQSAGISYRDNLRGRNSRAEELGAKYREAEKAGDAMAMSALETEARQYGGLRFPRAPSLVINTTPGQKDASAAVRNIMSSAAKRHGLVTPGEFEILWHGIETRDGKSYTPEQISQMLGISLMSGGQGE